MEDFNTAGPQESFDVIPDGTICTLQMIVRPGNAGPDSWLTAAHTAKGDSLNLDCEFVVVDGEHVKRKLWTKFTVSGDNHAVSTEISRKTLRAILESARGIRPDDKSEPAKQARQANYSDFNSLRFMACIGVIAPKDGYKAKNTIDLVITPNMPGYQQPQQVAIAAGDGASSATAPARKGGAAPTITDNAIGRPGWAA